MAPNERHLPDPKRKHGPYRLFTSDPGWNEAWWWLGIPILVAAFAIGAYQIAPDWYRRYVIPEGYGILEISHFIIPLFGLLIAGGLVFLPFVRARPLVFAVAIIGAVISSCSRAASRSSKWRKARFRDSCPSLVPTRFQPVCRLRQKRAPPHPVAKGTQSEPKGLDWPLRTRRGWCPQPRCRRPMPSNPP